MIRFIAALDKNLGIADNHGIPWLGRLPIDEKYFRDKTIDGNLLMGYGEYLKKEGLWLIAEIWWLPLRPNRLKTALKR